MYQPPLTVYILQRQLYSPTLWPRGSVITKLTAALPEAPREGQKCPSAVNNRFVKIWYFNIFIFLYRQKLLITLKISSW